TSGSTGVPKSIVYPMRKSLEILSQESDDILKTDDVQWLRGGTTFLRPLFEVRRFPFNKTVLHLDPGKSMEDQCRNLLWELQESSHTEPMRTHFTPSAFRVFFEYAKMMAGNTSPKFKRMYWLVLGGEAVTRDLTAIARRMFPNATIACNYAVGIQRLRLT
ncbi:uncharacterized protein EV422DRAFT_497017, partial [Fimicolochytrium jonesii]|uniref:uncharacterized protein n=1 Tax=Fimicolochytrium jonesii TaxID=1396493 RepID=UPI0022FF1B22